MTIQIPATTPAAQVLAFHHTDPELGKGYKLRILTGAAVPEVFITESDADKLGRYFLFEPEPAPEEPISVPTTGEGTPPDVPTPLPGDPETDSPVATDEPTA